MFTLRHPTVYPTMSIPWQLMAWWCKVFHEEEFQLPAPFQGRAMLENSNTLFSYFLEANSARLSIPWWLMFWWCNVYHEKVFQLPAPFWGLTNDRKCNHIIIIFPKSKFHRTRRAEQVKPTDPVSYQYALGTEIIDPMPHTYCSHIAGKTINRK